MHRAPRCGGSSVGGVIPKAVVDTTASTSATETLARFSAGLRFEDLPLEVVHELKRLLLDTVACGLGGLGLDKGSMALDLAVASGGNPEATVYGTTAKLPAARPPSSTVS